MPVFFFFFYFFFSIWPTAHSFRRHQRCKEGLGLRWCARTRQAQRAWCGLRRGKLIQTTSYLRYFCGWTVEVATEQRSGPCYVRSWSCALLPKGGADNHAVETYESHDGKTTTWPNLGAVRGKIKRPVEIRLLMTCRADETSCAGRRLVGGPAPVAADRVACRLSRWPV